MFLIVLFILLSGCSGSDSLDSESGDVVIGLTDAKGGYATYTVDVLSLTLTKSNGVVVETLPLNTRVDFAQYTELTEFLTAATVPGGVYTKASIVRPFIHRLAEDNRRFGSLNVHVNSNTVYEINGSNFEGVSGLEELDAQSTLTAVIVIGELKSINAQRVFVASQVYAGSSVPNGDDDVVSGHVIARSGNTLKLKVALMIVT